MFYDLQVAQRLPRRMSEKSSKCLRYQKLTSFCTCAGVSAIGIVLLVLGFNADSTGNGNACCDNLLRNLSGNRSTTSGHKADNAEPCRVLLELIEDVLEHTLAGMSKSTDQWT